MQAIESKEQRLYYIDLLESIAIFFVVVYHCTNYNCNFFPGGKENYPYYFRYFLRTILSCGVPLFFFANGYLLLNRKFILKKHLAKILKFTLVTIIWGIITLSVLMFIRNQYLSPTDFLTFLFYLRIDWNQHLWFMYTLIAIYLLFPLLKIVYDKQRSVFYIFTVILNVLIFGITTTGLIGAIVYHNSLFDDLIERYRHWNHFYWYSFAYFCLGGCAYQLKHKINILSKSWINLIIILLSMFNLFVMGVALSYLSHQPWDVVWRGYDTVFTLINVICIFFLCTKYQGKDNIFRKIIYVISLNTLGIYFIHVLFLQASLSYVSEIESLSNIPGNMVYSLAVLLLSLLTALVLRKIPVLKNLVR